jgi:hypothetical protein
MRSTRAGSTPAGTRSPQSARRSSWALALMLEWAALTAAGKVAKTIAD